MHLSSTILNAKTWSLSLSCLFSIKSFFLVLYNLSNLCLFSPAKLIWMSKIPSKVKVFVWLVAHKKVNTNDMLQLKRPFKALDLTNAFCIRGEMIDHLLFFFFTLPNDYEAMVPSIQTCKMEWVPPWNICDMITISYKGFKSSLNSKILWHIACRKLIWIMWWEGNASLWG